MKSSIDARSTSFEQNDVSSRLVLFLEVDRIKERTTSPEFTIVNPYLDSRLYTVLACVPCICIKRLLLEPSAPRFHFAPRNLPSSVSYLTIHLSRIRRCFFCDSCLESLSLERPLNVQEYEFIEANLENFESAIPSFGRNTDSEEILVLEIHYR